MSKARKQTPVIPESFGDWYCVLVRPGWMARTEGELYSLGYRVFTPKLRKWASHARQKTAVYRPVLSRYLFVSIDHPKQSFGGVWGCRGVEKILTNLGIPLAFSTRDVAKFIERQMRGEWDQVSKEPAPIGSKVVIMDGQHADMEAIVTGHKGRKVHYKVVGEAKQNTTYEMSVRAA